jgi:hypothetical protein
MYDITVTDSHRPAELRIVKVFAGRITIFRGKTMFENKHEIQKDPLLLIGGVALVAGAAVLHDYIKGGREIAQLRTETELLTHEVMDADQTVIQFVGCMQDAKDTDEELSPLIPGVNLIVVRLPQTTPDGKIDHDGVSAQIVEQLIKTRAHKPVILADSKGAQDAVKLLQFVDHMGMNELFDGFGKVVFNASPHDGEDITDSRQRLLMVAKALKHFAFANHVKPYFMQRAGYNSSAAASLSEIVLAGRDIQRSRAVNPLPNNFEELIYIRGEFGDPTVFTAQAAEKFSVDTPLGKFTEYIDYSRQSGTHIGGRERFYLMLEQARVIPIPAKDSPMLTEEVALYFDHAIQAA